jgi:hypothetical protein
MKRDADGWLVDAKTGELNRPRSRHRAAVDESAAGKGETALLATVDRRSSRKHVKKGSIGALVRFFGWAGVRPGRGDAPD